TRRCSSIRHIRHSGYTDYGMSTLRGSSIINQTDSRINGLDRKQKTEPRTPRTSERVERDCAMRRVATATLHLKLRDRLLFSGGEASLDIFVKYSNEVRHDRWTLKRDELASVDIHRSSRVFARAWE